MENLAAIGAVFIGCISVVLVSWLIVHFNGKTIISTIDLIACLFARINQKSNNISRKWLTVATEKEVIILGILPLAIASLVSTYGNNCYNSISAFLITEAVILSLLCLNFRQAKWKFNLFNIDFFKRNLFVFILAILWCLTFSIWWWLSTNSIANIGLDRLVINSNADMWFYTRRFAAYISKNIDFDNLSACSYLQISPKKFSSFIGSIIVYFSPKTVFGITLFQGLLSCSLFLSLFGSWCNFVYNGKKISHLGTFFTILWAVSSPMIFWLIVTSYASNILFITIFVLGLTICRNISLNQNIYPQFVEPIILFSFVFCIFSFYMVLLPVALFFYLTTLIIYQYEKYFFSKIKIKNFAKLMLISGGSILFCIIFFQHHIGLNEVTGTLDVIMKHGKNFVPLNPWSLLQERLNPMPDRRDFGVWFNLSIGIIFSSFALKIIYDHLISLKNQNLATAFYYKDLIAAGLVIISYLIYLFAYISLDFTYRLGKFAISIIYPLAILGLLPTIIWYRDRYYRYKSSIVKLIYSGLITLHIILHIDKAIMSSKPMGRYQILSNQNIQQINSLTIIKCQKSQESQKYQKIVGLDLAKKYPNLKINVLRTNESIISHPLTDIVLKGKDIIREDKNGCLFDIEL